MYKLILPIYYTQEFKTKPSKTFMIGLNWYRNSHYILSNNVKKYYHELIIDQLQGFECDRLEKYRVKYKLYYKRNNSDLMNIVSVVDKFMNDALIEFGLIEDDNVTVYKKMFAEVVEQDKNNPRLEVEIECL